MAHDDDPPALAILNAVARAGQPTPEPARMRPENMTQEQRETYRPETTRTGGGMDPMADYLYAKGEL